ncbi:MAG: DUF4136 domain-containing protein [Nitrospira sp.]|nr:DUF4136 domain-containing protein [Nitrospira sp.]
MQGWLNGVAAMFVACAAGCTSIDVKTDFDPAVDFSRFKTFAFTGLTDLNKTGVLDNSLMRHRLETMIDRELRQKGLTQTSLDQHPDLLVHYWVGVKDKEQLQSRPGNEASNWGERYGWSTSYSGVSTYEYREGTLITDLVEPASKTLVWQATIVAELKDDVKKNIALTEKAIKKAFENYPPSKTK